MVLPFLKHGLEFQLQRRTCRHLRSAGCGAHWHTRALAVTREQARPWPAAPAPQPPSASSCRLRRPHHHPPPRQREARAGTTWAVELSPWRHVSPRSGVAVVVAELLRLGSVEVATPVADRGPDGGRPWGRADGGLIPAPPCPGTTRQCRRLPRPAAANRRPSPRVFNE